MQLGDQSGFEVGEASKVCKFLGLKVDSRDMTFNIPVHKLEKIRSWLGLVRRLSWPW